MSDYRLYCLNSEGHICFAEEIEADSDEEAVMQARTRKNGALVCEVWSGPRMVAKLEAHDLAG